MMQRLKGIPASPGLASGPAFLVALCTLTVPRRQDAEPAQELARLAAALQQARSQIEALQAQAKLSTGAEEAAIFEAHALFLEDPSLLASVRKAIQQTHSNAEAAWWDGIEGYAQQLDGMSDELFRARAADVRDVGRRVLGILLGEEESVSELDQPSIVLARELTPSDTVQFDEQLVLGFATAEGGPTSDAAILAKALGIPAIVGLGDSVLDIEPGTDILIDGGSGELIAAPRTEETQVFEARKRQYDLKAQEERAAAGQVAVTRDGHPVEMVANVGNPEDAQTALKFGAEGIGLFRTEFLFLERTQAPDEDEQLAGYAAVLEIMGSRPVVVRTLDVGGDKPLPYLDLGQEANPFLGWRALRMCLDRPDFFKTQLRALLRAGCGHDLRLMFPMVADVSEVRRARQLLSEARQEVLAADHQAANSPQIGIMVEIPSVAVMADRFAGEVDFFSVGTNDLTQYTMAAERTNERVAHLVDACHPAVLRQIQRVIEAGHAAGIWVGVCGELAGDTEGVPVLLGLGLDEFSIAPSLIPRAKAIVRRWSYDDARRLALQVLDLDSASAVRRAVRQAGGG
jgi:phosphoenolpyruvate-protein phosphotransferase